jgi:type II secretory pathway pseudopilin PulG
VNERGFTLVEAVFALGILATVILGVVPTFQALLDANTFGEVRSNGVAAAQQVLEALRQQRPSTFPLSGSSAVQSVYVGDFEYEVVAHYCTRSTFCTTSTRHIVLEVTYGGDEVYDVETVFTELQ